jgi:small subunit ribosomal protein S6
MRGFAPEQTTKERQFMPLYEHVFLARQDISAQQVEALLQTFRSLIEERGGQVGKTEYWGLRTLAYRIKKNRKAHYALMNIDAPHEAVAEMERQMRLSTDIIRFLTVKVDEHETGPSPMMRRADRDERDGRGDRGDRRGGRYRDRDFAPREARETAESETEETPEGAEEESQ